MTATTRPYLKRGIADLEAQHAAAPGDRRLNQAILEELQHRSTVRSAALKKRIEQSLSTSTLAPGLESSVAEIHRSSPKSPTILAKTKLTDTEPASASRETVRLSSSAPNDPSSILSCWTAIEALSPQTYRKPADLCNGEVRCVASLDQNLPWIRGESSRPSYQLYYQVVLGSISLDEASEALNRVFGEDEERPQRERLKAAIAAVMVDRNGIPLKENAVAISSFAWALPIALGGDLSGLNNWLMAEANLIAGLTERLSRVDENGNQLPLDTATISAAFNWLVDALRLPQGFYEPPTFAVRIYHFFKAKNPPEVFLLNSFFLADLSRASQLIANDGFGKALKRYLGAEKVEPSLNLLNDHSGIEDLIAPAKISAARWPSPGGHPLVTLQQAAVNAARDELRISGLLAVNGPPGTGKTTLLRDVVAGCVLDRAIAMAAFDDPSAAFTASGQKISAGGQAFLHLYRLNSSLKGHEVLIASSNNKAVENVSKELPAIKAVGRDLKYFRTVSDQLLATRDEASDKSVGEPSWGLIAAVLGNAKNRNAFQQALWWDTDKSLRLYLKAAKGDSVVKEIQDETGKVIKREVPTIIKEEAPPTPEQAKAAWRKARVSFKALESEVKAELGRLEEVRQRCLQLPAAQLSLMKAQLEQKLALEALAARTGELAVATEALAHAKAEADLAQKREYEVFGQRPGWFSRLFRTGIYRNWLAIYKPLAEGLAGINQALVDAEANRNEVKRLVETAMMADRIASNQVEACQHMVSQLETYIGECRKTLGDRLVDGIFFKRGHEFWNLASPWIPDTLHAKREDLFAAAIALHKAFIDVAAQKISHNLGVLMGAMQSGAFTESAKKDLLPDLWSTLFMVVPAVSTTFASVDRMLGDMPPSSIGWLLIDEAGQASPQAAVGAIMRCKRVIAVGDPLQIPPVVSLAQKLVSDIARYFNVSPEVWAAPEASVQTVADQASRLRAELQADVGVRHIGLPLLVHRRCQEPMFGISNRIAYDGQMVHATENAQDCAIAEVLGPSSWFDVDGSADTKWCPAEGDVVVRLLSQLAATGVRDPDVYVITPFRIVAHEMRKRLEREATLFDQFDVERSDWLRNRVGTIHTFQGKEAKAVIAILGAPMSSQQGARRWAASTPNILNVMVSRAKSRLYVVGSRAAWCTVGHARELAGCLPSSSI